jgi:uncharacterized RDD family membrane protein YckC
VSASPPTKVSARRYLSHLIDALIRIAAGVIPFVLLADRSQIDPTVADQYDRVDTFVLNGVRTVRIDDRLFQFGQNELLIVAAVAIGVTLLFDVIVQGRAGWTVGKALTGLRTVNKRGERCGIFRALIRTVLLVIDLIPSYLFPLVGGLFIFASDSNRRLGDLVGGTYVVDKDAWGEDPLGEDDIDTTAWTDLDEHPGHVTRLAEGESLKVGEQAAAESPKYQPQWDPARKAYLQWDPRRKTWLQFDDDAQEWRPIS